MRVLVELGAVCDCVYDLMYHHKLQGFLYDLLRGSSYGGLHDRRGYKFFCFSNIFPSVDMREGDVRRFLFSSPDAGLIQVLVEQLDKLQRRGERINVGEMSFCVEGVSVLEPRVGRSCVLAAGTPIVIRIPRANYARYGIEPPEDYKYVYWRKQYPFDAFVRQLEDNLFKKYNTFYGTQLEAFPIFEQFTFQKQVCNHLVIDGREVKILGSIWRFPTSGLSEERWRILQFGLDSGFGELNSAGFGFMNLVKDNQQE
jgi:CRISPR-associated endoribonuclease Cas6